jgi:ABC-type glycerol-3-phosphate transport system substrate-binding protein
VGGVKGGETTIYQLLPFLWSTGGKLFSDGNVVLGKQAVIALEFLVALVHKYQVASPDVVSFEWDRAARLFAQGRVAMAIGGSYEKALIQKVSGWNEEAFRERVGCIPIPAGPGGESAATVGGMVYVIFRQSRDAKLALEILKRVVSLPLMREFCTRTGRNPTRVSVAQIMDPEKAWFSYRGSKLLHSAGARPTIPKYAKVSEQLQLMIENAISKRMSPQQAVEKAREIIAAMIS